MLKSNSQSRKWLITLNNPQDIDIDLDKFTEKIRDLNPDYFCVCKEIAQTGTPHFHGFIYSASPKRFGTLKKVFPAAHLDKGYGTCRENRTYLLKEGKWEDDHKHDTKVPGTFKEEGDLPNEKEEKHPDLYKVIDMIKNGAITTDVIEEYPQYAMQSKHIEELRTLYCGGMESKKERDVNVIYIYAPEDFDQISLVYEKHQYSEVCRITNYNPYKGISFDTYKFQKVLVFENFSEQISLQDLVLYLGKYPVSLPARYEDRDACYDTVYILATKPLEDMYVKEYTKNPGLWRRFNNSINTLITVNDAGEIEEKENEKL